MNQVVGIKYIYLNIDEIYLDYSNANQPQIILPKNTAEIASEFLELCVTFISKKKTHK